LEPLLQSLAGANERGI